MGIWDGRRKPPLMGLAVHFRMMEGLGEGGGRQVVIGALLFI